MQLVSVTRQNLAKEHICCAIANESDVQVCSKKAWLDARFDDGLVFLKGDVRGKCFIEYIPAENAWAPIEADGYMYIDCMWVSGQFKGQGNSNLLLDACIKDSKEKGRRGLVILSADKKRPFLSDPKYLAYKGFKTADEAKPYYRLMYLPFDEAAPKPRFRAQVKAPHVDEGGYVLYYANQCPFTAKYVPVIENVAKEMGASFKAVRFNSAAEAQNAPAPFTSYSMFYNGEFLTNEIFSEPKFRKLLEQKA